MDEFFYIRKCLELLEHKVGEDESSSWSNTQFEKLAEDIYAATGTLISTSTLKRLYGRMPTYKADSKPQLATKNAIVKYLGYKNWSDFIRTYNMEGKEQIELLATASLLNSEALLLETVPTVSDKQVRAAEKSVSKPYFKIALGLGVLVMLISMRIWFFYATKPQLVPFTCSDPKGVYPHSVTFKYDISHVEADSVFLYLSNTKSYLLSKQERSIKLDSLLPGFYKTKLLANDRVISPIRDVFVSTNGWKAFVNSKPINTNIHYPGRLYASPEDIQKAGLLKKEYWLEYALLQDFNLSSENAFLEVKCRNNLTEGGIGCFDFVFLILGDQDKARINFVGPDCPWFVKLDIADVSLRGNQTDLSAFARNLSDWHTVTVYLKNKKADILFDYRKIYEVKYQKPIGNIKGIKCLFKGSGSIDYISLTKDENKIVYKETFGD